MTILVIDTNILISALIKNSTTREILTDFRINFLFPEFGLDEIYSCKREIMKKSTLTEKGLDILLLRILKHIRLIPLDLIISKKEEADKIIGNIDKNDAAFIAYFVTLICLFGRF